MDALAKRSPAGGPPSQRSRSKKRTGGTTLPAPAPVVADLTDAPPPTGAHAASSSAARRALLRVLYRDFGVPGSYREAARGDGFDLQPAYGEGVVETDHRVAVPLPGGGVTWHTLAVAVVVGERWVGIDFVRAADGREPLKARAFDLLHLKAARPGSEAVLVLLRASHGGVAREEVDAVAYGYDHVFGMDEAAADADGAFNALRADLRRRILRLAR